MGQSGARSHVLWFLCTMNWTNYKFDRTISSEMISYVRIVPAVHICILFVIIPIMMDHDSYSYYIDRYSTWQLASSHLLDKPSARLARARYLDVGEEAICTWPFGCGWSGIFSGSSGLSSVKSVMIWYHQKSMLPSGTGWFTIQQLSCSSMVFRGWVRLNFSDKDIKELNPHIFRGIDGFYNEKWLIVVRHGWILGRHTCMVRCQRKNKKIKTISCEWVATSNIGMFWHRMPPWENGTLGTIEVDLSKTRFMFILIDCTKSEETN